MNTLPLILDTDEAKYIASNNKGNDPLICYCVKFLLDEGYKNRRIREVLEIDKVYVCSHYISIAKKIDDNEYTIWLNSDVITLGHMRTLSSLEPGEIEEYMRKINAGKWSISTLKNKVIGNKEKDIDNSRYAQEIGEQLGRKVTIRYNKNKEYGSISLDFFRLEDLESLVKKLGYKAREGY